MKKVKLAIVISHPIQHFAPLYAELAKSPEITLKVFFLAENGLTEYRDHQFDANVKWDVPLVSGYQHQFLQPGRIIRRFTFWSMDSNKIVAALRSFAPDLIWLHGYAQLANWRVLLAKPGDSQIIYSSDSNLADSRSWWRRLIKTMAIKIFFKRCDHFLSISPSNRAYLRRYNVPAQKIHDSAFPIDMSRLQRDRASLTDSSRQALRKRLNLGDRAVVILFVGKLIQRKRPQDVLRAISRMHNSFTTALIVGSGDQQLGLQALAIELGIEEQLRFTGFINQGELAAYFDLADILVFPSEDEPYGTITAEALPFGLPMVVATGVGAIGASVIEGRNALLYAVGDVDQLAYQLTLIVDDGDLKNNLSKASLQLASAHDKSVMARDIMRICKNRAIELSHS